jgi:monovalent cation:H+ antiporter, CPA1 family
VGLLIATQPNLRVEVTPEIILALFVPPLVFETAFHVGLARLRKNLGWIMVMAVPGVLLTIGIVGFIVATGTGIGIEKAILFGALVSATDPVAVCSLFRTLGSPKSLSTLVEGESLLNEGTTIILFNLILAIIVSGAVSLNGPAAIDLTLGAVWYFVRVIVGGVATGVSLGWLFSQIIARVDDHLVGITLTVTLAFGCYITAEHFQLSGVLAAVTAGLIAGDLGRRGMSPTTRVALSNFWEYLAFMANILVFLLIGLQISIPSMIGNMALIAVAVIGILASRALAGYGFSWLASLRSQSLSFGFQHVIFWGGLRGAISLALALSLPAGFAGREVLQSMAFGVTLFTLLVQGTTIQFLLDRLGLVRRGDISR